MVYSTATWMPNGVLLRVDSLGDLGRIVSADIEVVVASLAHDGLSIRVYGLIWIFAYNH